MFKNLIDDSKERINYYQSMLKDSNRTVLEKIIEVLNAWSKIRRTGRFNIEEETIFRNAICESHEYIWYEAGKKLIKLIQYDKSIRGIFIDVFTDKNWKHRFNVVALSKNFDKELAELILRKGIDDKSSKVREMVADVILSREDKYLVPVLEERLERESNKDVRIAIKFTLENIHKLKRDKHGRIVFSINRGKKPEGAGLNGLLPNDACDDDTLAKLEAKHRG
jgi:hypothetical protein